MVTQLFSNFAVTLRTHLRHGMSMCQLNRCHATSCQTFRSPCAHISLRQVRAPRLRRRHTTPHRLWCHLDRCHTTPHRLWCHLAHTSSVMACRLVNSADVTQPRVKLLGHLAHTSLFVKCARLDCADVTQLLTDFGVTLRTHLRLDMSVCRIHRWSHNSSQTFR
jgi:hypothetical protein